MLDYMKLSNIFDQLLYLEFNIPYNECETDVLLT